LADELFPDLLWASSRRKFTLFFTSTMANTNLLQGYLTYPLRTRLLLALIPILILTYLVQPFSPPVHSHFRTPTDNVILREQGSQYPADPHHAALAQLRPKRILVVGAGAGGSAAAFFLRRAARVMEERIGVDEGRLVGDIVVIDKEGYVGGSELTLPPQ
jgi:prenylcysteine oxidase/farnesylcysteine lyase